MPNTKTSAGEYAGLGIDLYPSDTQRTDGSRFGSMVVSAGSPPSLSRVQTNDSHDLRPPVMPPSCSKDLVGVHTAALALEPALQSGSLNLPASDLCEELALSRNDTILAASASIGRSSAELNTILGNANSRLKSGASLVPILGEDMEAVSITTLEQAKNQTRVDLDIALESNVCVQDGYLKGHIKVRIWKHSKKDHPVLVSGGKVRVIGFECIMNGKERLAFYQVSAPLSEVASDLGNLYVFEPDGEGFRRALDGVYSFPFALHLPLSSEHGTPKGVMHSQSGVSIRYIVMVSIRVKDAISGEKSIAHFYRDCSIWPRLNPSVVLAPLPRPLQVTVSGSLSMGGNNGIQLTASLYRLNWIAGQPCQVKITISNNSKKNIKNLTLGIYRSIIIFKPKVPLETLPDNKSTFADLHAWQTSATKKLVAESTLAVCEPGTRGHASAKGWWTGIGPGKSMAFSHFISIPPDALSIPRGQLLEVLYVLRVTISSGSLLPTDVHATLPLHIVNFLSIDPPISSPYIPSTQLDSNLFNTRTVPALCRPNSVDSERSEANFVEEPIDDEDSFYSSDDIQDDPKGLAGNGGHGLGNLSLHDDTDEVVQYALASARSDVEYGEDAPRFADLYYSSLQENLDRAAEQCTQNATDNSVSQTTRSDGSQGKGHNFASRVHEKTLRHQSERYTEEAVGDAALSEELDIIHRIPHLHHPNSNTQPEPRTAGRSDATPTPRDHYVAPVTASSKLGPPIPPSKSHQGPRSFHSAEIPSIHNQNPVKDVYSIPIEFDPHSTSTTTASRSKSVKDKVRELEKRVERANIDA